MSAEVAASQSTEDLERNTQPVDAGGGSVGGQDDMKKSLKRKSSDSIMVPNPTTLGVKRAKKFYKRRIKSISQKFLKHQRKSKSSGEKMDSTTTSKRIKRKRRATGSFNAPFNSTQFLMNDHVSEAVKHLNSTLNVKQKSVEAVDEESSLDSSLLEQRPVRRITRARESSFSIDSDEDYYYSSPEDEEEFLSREFIKDYDNVRNDRLVDMSKAELINEYLQMEQRIEALEKRLSSSDKALNKSSDDMANTIQKFQHEIQRLESENDELKKRKECSSCSCSDDSSSSSSSSSESEDDSDQSDSENEAHVPVEAIDIGKIDQVVRKMLRDQDPQDDTGYESGNSHNNQQNNAEAKNNINIDTTEETQAKLNASISVNCITSTSL